MSRYVLAIDQGTTSSRAIVFDAQMRIGGLGQKEFTQHYPASGWVEHDPEEIWSTVLWAARTALRKAKLNASDIAAIGITNQRETIVIWDKATGKPIHKDRKSTRLNSSHVKISYAVFCLKKKKQNKYKQT